MLHEELRMQKLSSNKVLRSTFSGNKFVIILIVTARSPEVWYFIDRILNKNKKLRFTKIQIMTKYDDFEMEESHSKTYSNLYSGSILYYAYCYRILTFSYQNIQLKSMYMFTQLFYDELFVPFLKIIQLNFG